MARLVMFSFLRHYGVPDNVKKSWFLYSGTKSAVQSQLDLLCLMAEEVGLYIITTKTKLITCNIPHSSPQLEGEDIENVGKDKKCQKGKALSAFWKLDHAWKSLSSL